jgi:hypothetical protein
MVVSPQFARDANPADVRTAVEAARRVYRLYNAEDRLTLDEPWDYTRLTQNRTIDWLNRISNNLNSPNN